MPRAGAVGSAWDEIGERLRLREAEIKDALLARMRSISLGVGKKSSEHVQGLRIAIDAATEHAIAAIELGEERCPSPPPPLLSQARLAARQGIGIDAIYRRYVAGQALITDFLIAEAQQDGISTASLKSTLRSLASAFDRLL